MINFVPNEKFTNVLSLLKNGKINKLLRSSDFDEYKEFIKHFPASKLTSLTLDQYCIGKKDNANFCWWIERGLVKPLGRFSPGSSRGHIIYYNKNGDIYKNDKLKDLTDNEALIYTLKIQSVIANADTNSDLSWIDNDNEIYEHAKVKNLVTIGNARKLRLLSCYKPELFIPISSSEHLGHFLKVFGCPDDSIPNSDKPIARMLLLLELYKLACKEIELKNLSTLAFMQALYNEELNIAPIKDKDPITGVDPKIWKISHGNTRTGLSQDEHDSFLKKGYVAMGRLNKPDDKQRKKFEAIKSTEYFYLVRNAEIILLGQLEDTLPEEVEGINRICRKFKPVRMLDEPYPVEKLDQKHLRHGGMPSSNSTVEKINSKDLKYFESDVLRPVFKLSLEDLIITPSSNENLDDRNQPTGNKMHSLNQILYGPPGTGKTYNTVTEALKVLVEIIVDEEEYEDGYSKDKRRFDALKAKGHIEFITFHQSFSYEDFVEGIRAETHDGSISYSVKDGIFKKIAIEALFSKLELSGDKLEEAWKKVIDTNNVIVNKKITDGTTFDSNNRDHKKLIVAIHKMSDFKKGKGKPYVLIIDEINRGNTSRIFGELITLIESTKRAGSDEAMDAVLPYSQETFTVPDNLYIIGTMNTADRSLALIDTALRRRFDFIEKMPDVKLIEDIEIKGIEIGKMLQTINDRIEVLYDREHTIGHAFFMKLTDDSDITDLASVFRRNILPLLEEYFFEDWKKICQVLGKSGIYKVKDFKEPGLSTGNNYSRDEKLLAIPETYINIYKDTDSTQRDSTGPS